MGAGRPKKYRRTVPAMTYLSTAEDRAMRAACEAEPVTMAAFIRRLVVAELSRLRVRGRLAP